MGGQKFSRTQPSPKHPLLHTCAKKFKKKKKKKKNRREQSNDTPKQKKKTRNKVEKKKKMMAAQSFEGSPAQQRVGTTSVCAPKSTTTKFCCTMHVRKRRPALLKKLCPPALCDKNQVPSMCFFFSCFIEWVTEGGRGWGVVRRKRRRHERSLRRGR